MITLPKSGQKVLLREYFTHGAMVKVQEALLDGVEITQAMVPSKEEILQYAGAEKAQELSELPPEEYESHLNALREEFVRSKLQVSGVTLKNAERANIARIEAMVREVDGKEVQNLAAWANDLHQKDFEYLVEEITKLENDEEGKKD